MSEYIDRDTIEHYLCSSGLEKARRLFKFHFVQHTAYDCGPACCWMIIKWAKRFIINDEFNYVGFLQSTSSNMEDGIWTIELVKMLKDYSFRCIFCTTNTSPTLHQYDYLDFYNGDMDSDILHIQSLFLTISSESVHIFNAKVTMDTIRDFLLMNSNVVVLVLTDYSELYPKQNCCCFKEYCGHYIILIGYSQSRKAFRIVDPLRYFHHYVKENVIEMARTAKGTDDDIIFVNLE